MIKLNDVTFPVSFSQSRVYSECPMKYNLKYAEGIKEPSNPNLDLGNAIHYLAETHTWENAVAVAIGADLDVTGLPQKLVDAIKLVINNRGSRYFTQLMSELSEFFSDKQILSSELELRDNDYTLKIDIIYRTKDDPYKIYLADFKVTKKPKTADSVFEEGQLLFYKERYCNKLGIEPSNVYVQYINILSYMSDKLVTVTTPLDVSIETCTNYRKQIIDKNVELINAKHFPKKKKWCNWCFYKDICDTL